MKRKILVNFIIIIFCLSMTCFTFATSVDSLKDKQKELEDKQNDAKEDLQEVKKEKSEIMSKVEELNGQINASENELDELNSQISELEKSIKNKKNAITEAEKKQEEQQILLEDRLIAQYKAGSTSYLDVLLKSDSLSNFLSKYFMIGQVAKIDQQLIDDIKTEKENIEREKKELEEQQDTIKTVQAKVEKENTKLKDIKSQKDAEVAKLSAEEKQIQAKIDEYKKEIRKAEQEIQNAIKAAEKYNSTGNGAGASKPLTGGKLEWPLPSKYATYSRITSYFGPRKRPTAGASTNHGAIDIGIPQGTAVYSAEQGTVITAQWYGGYGNFIMVRHDNGLVTAYGHLSSIKVRVGQRVSRGEQIAASGNTGVSTGPHLHFEVRLNPYKSSNRVDPLNYLSL